MGTLWQDLRYGVRMLWKSPGFAAVAVLSLALGIGANTAMFSVINTTLLRPLPVVEPERLVTLNGDGFSYPNYVDYRDRDEAFDGVIAYRYTPLNFGVSGENERIWGYLATGNYFDLLGIRAALGRTFTPEEDRPRGGHPVAVISYGLWQRRFNSDPHVLSQTITLNNHSFNVIGVAPRNFAGTEQLFAPDVWIPIMMQPVAEPGRERLDLRGEGWLQVIARLKPGVTLRQAQAATNNLAAQLAREYPRTNEGMTVKLFPAGAINPAVHDQAVIFLLFLMAVVGLVLLIACVNVASLMLARALARRKEIAIRLALGAGRTHIVRQLLTESVLVSTLGGALGLILALWIIDLIAAFRPPIEFQLALDLHLDHRVLLFTLLVSLATGVAFGLVPALQASRADLVPALKDDLSTQGHRRSRARSALVTTQIALSLVLLIGAALFVRSLQHAQMMSPGFDPQHVVAASFDLSLQGYDEARGQGLQRQLIERIESQPGVESASLTNLLPLSLGSSYTGIYIEGMPPKSNAERPSMLYSIIAPRYFATMGIPLVAGRDFGERDKKGAPNVYIINETMARRFWPNESAVGKRLSFEGPQGPWHEIIGVAKDGKYRTLGENPQPFLYMPLLQHYDGQSTLLVRLKGNNAPAAIDLVRREVRTIDDKLPLYDIKTLREHMGLALFPARVAATLLGVFGLLALLLAAIGVYGVMAYSVSQRTREIGIRIALGAQTDDVLKLVVKQGMILALIGIALGLAGALALARVMSNLLYGVSATDPTTFIGVSLLLAGIALVACLIPARRATKVDPMAALHYE